MTGNNSVVLSAAAMNDAVQHYFRTVLFQPKSCPKVTSVVSEGYGSDALFRVAIVDKNVDKVAPDKTVEKPA